MDLDLGGIKCYEEMNDDIETTNEQREQGTQNGRLEQLR